MARTDTTACILCSRNCGLSVEIEDNQFKKIKGDKDHPFTQGYICRRRRGWSITRTMTIA